ncbi:potassium-transporting ATPase subunit KdpA [Vulcanococcus limneticus]|uniref:potassium-transporting ATPase subunit KdpA n=1 Tax=Vulcanococcus limneticus TaxID=2170428 RepID=UPI00398BE8C9
MLPWLLAAVTLAAVVLTAPALGRHLFEVFDDQPQPAWDRWLNPVESALLRWIGEAGRSAESTRSYLQPLLISNGLFGLLALTLLLLQPGWLNPLGFTGLPWDLALHTTISFLTNTDQQHLIPEQSLGNLAQLGAMQFLMFVSAATGLAVGFAVIRGFSGRPLGNFYRDLLRSLTRVLIPGSLLLALFLLVSGVPMTLAPPLEITTLEGGRQWLPRGPIALFEAIKQLGENGGGFLSANSAHPYENPTLLTNLVSTWAMLLIPAATLDAFGRFVGNRRQSNLLLVLVVSLMVIGAGVAMAAEQAGNPLLSTWISGGNLQGKELRFGPALTGFWTVVSTGTMTGAANGAIDAAMPLTILTALFNLFLQVVFGGQGTGMAYLLVFALLAVFLTGLMVGRTPEFLGRKVEKPQVVWASLVLLIHPLFVLLPAALTLAGGTALAGLTTPDSHGISQVVYEYASAAANNGSGLEGLTDGTPWWNLTTSLSLLGGRYLPIAALLALADGFRRKPALEPSPGSLRTDTGLFTGVTAVVLVILGALTFFPVLALGPIAEALTLAS